MARESRALIAGDMVASVGTILVESPDGDMQQYLDSLRAMEALAPSQLLPAHGLPILDARERLQFYVQHRLMREEKIYAALVALGRPARLEELVPIAYADKPAQTWPLALLSTEAHLLKLVRDRRVQRRADAWLAH